MKYSISLPEGKYFDPAKRSLREPNGRHMPDDFPLVKKLKLNDILVEVTVNVIDNENIVYHLFKDGKHIEQIYYSWLEKMKVFKRKAFGCIIYVFNVNGELELAITPYTRLNKKNDHED